MSSIHTTIFNKKIELIEEGESVSQKDIEKVDFEIFQELEELFIDNEEL